MSNAGIYIIKNNVNNKCYIGQSVNINSRLYKHKYELNNNTHNNNYLQNAWNKYGEDNFEFDVLYTVPSEIFSKDKIRSLLDNMEIKYINKYNSLINNNGYNIQLGGNSGRHNQITKNKLREINLGKKISDETRAKMSNNNYWLGKNRSGELSPMYGKKHSGETKVKMSNSHKGKKFTQRHKDNIRKARIGVKMNDNTKHKISDKLKGKNNPFYGKTHSEDTIRKIKKASAKRVHCITTNMYFDSLKEASVFYGCDRGGIGKCCNGKTDYFYKIKDKHGKIIKLKWEFV